MQLYLEVCVDEDDDGALIRAALGDIAKAKNMRELAKKVEISREGLYKALSEKGNPSFAFILRLSRALNMQLKFSTEHPV